jgi:hypothetical protein
MSSSSINNLDLVEHKIPNDLLISTSLKTKINESFVKVNEEVKGSVDRDTGDNLILPLTNQSSNSEQNTNAVKQQPLASPQQTESTPSDSKSKGIFDKIKRIFKF